MGATVEQAPPHEDRTSTIERDRLQREILDRIAVTFSATTRRESDEAWLEERIGAMVRLTRLFMGFHIPLWPPRALIRKLTRFVAAPLFGPQVLFNEAVRDVVLDLRQRMAVLTASQEEALQTSLRLEAEVEELQDQLRAARREIAALTAAAPSGDNWLQGISEPPVQEAAVAPSRTSIGVETSTR